MATVNTQDYVAYEDMNVLIEGEDNTKISVANAGKILLVGDCIYTITNRIIETSKGYCDEKLTKYLNFSGMRWMFLLTLIATFPGPFVHFYYSLIGFVFMLPWMLWFSQHLYVVLKTIPRVLKQPRIKHPCFNVHLKITIDSESRIFIKDKNENIQLDLKGNFVNGQIVHFLSHNGAGKVKSSVYFSVVMFITTCVFILSCIGGMLYHGINNCIDSPYFLCLGQYVP